MGQITFGGIASGLDTNSIISALVALERRPIDLLGTQRSQEQSKLNLYGTLEGLVKTLQTKAQDLTGDFFAFKLSASAASVADFTLSSGAQSGSHTLEVNSLAAADRYTFQAVPDPDAGLGAGTITFDYESDLETAGQESFTVNISAGSDSLNDVASAINSQAGDAVTASVINIGTAASPSYQLVLAGNDTGADYKIDNLQVSGATSLALDTNVTMASNAEIVLDGIDIARSSNTFSDVLAGVSFTVSETNTGFAETFAVDADPEGVKANLQEFIDAYNGVADFINQQNEFDPDSGPGGALFGDSALRTISSTISSALLDVDPTVVQNDDEGYSTLGLVGIEFSADGKLSIDDETFDAKLAENPGLLGDLFTKEDTDPDDGVDERGLLRKLDDAIEALIKDSTALDPDGNPVVNPATGEPIGLKGIFNSRRGVINNLIEDVDKQVERLERNVEEFEQDMILRFSRLESLISGLNAQSQFLSSGLAFNS